MATEVHIHDPQALYEQWERSQWNPWDVDLAADGENWQGMDEGDRGLILWALSSLLVAEERIATKFSSLVMAYDSEEEESFLATQQVDEIRHLQFYNRFQNEAVADPATIAAHVTRAREQLSDSFRRIFDAALVGAHERLAADPRDRAAKVDFVTTYHMVIEGTLGVTAFHFISDYLRREGLLPGFVDGYSHIAEDERRHIGYGVWFLREAVDGDPGLGDDIRRTLREMLPAVAESLTPPDREGTDWEALGASAEEVRDFALGGLRRRLAIVGVPLESL
ncbi:MAG: ribonucleotide-diphosphate reductase subunit beta [Actinomycetota bacterium]